MLAHASLRPRPHWTREKKTHWPLRRVATRSSSKVVATSLQLFREIREVLDEGITELSENKERMEAGRMQRIKSIWSALQDIATEEIQELQRLDCSSRKKDQKEKNGDDEMEVIRLDDLDPQETPGDGVFV